MSSRPRIRIERKTQHPVQIKNKTQIRPQDLPLLLSNLINKFVHDIGNVNVPIPTALMMEEHQPGYLHQPASEADSITNLEELKMQIQKAFRYIQNLRDLAERLCPEMPVTKKPGDLTKLIATLQENYPWRWPNLQFDLSNLGTVTTDWIVLEHVLFSMFDFFHNYSPQGTQPLVITATRDEEDKEVVLTIKDPGVEITLERYKEELQLPFNSHISTDRAVGLMLNRRAGISFGLAYSDDRDAITVRISEEEELDD